MIMKLQKYRHRASRFVGHITEFLCALLAIIVCFITLGTYFQLNIVPSGLLYCWLGVMKSIQPVKKFSDEVLVLLSVWIEVQIVCIWSS